MGFFKQTTIKPTGQHILLPVTIPRILVQIRPAHTHMCHTHTVYICCDFAVWRFCASGRDPLIESIIELYVSVLNISIDVIIDAFSRPPPTYYPPDTRPTATRTTLCARNRSTGKGIYCRAQEEAQKAGLGTFPTVCLAVPFALPPPSPEGGDSMKSHCNR